MKDKKNLPLLIITGKQGEGKTTLLKEIVSFLAEKGLKAGGILSEGTWQSNLRDEIFATDLSRGNKILFCRRTNTPGWERLGHFFVNPAFEKFAETALGETNCDFYVVDEIGKFELEEKGWFVQLQKMVNETSKPMVWVIRDVFVADVSEKMSVIPEKLIHADTKREINVQGIISDSLRNLIAQKKRKT